MSYPGHQFLEEGFYSSAEDTSIVFLGPLIRWYISEKGFMHYYQYKFCLFLLFLKFFYYCSIGIPHKNRKLHFMFSVCTIIIILCLFLSLSFFFYYCFIGIPYKNRKLHFMFVPSSSSRSSVSYVSLSLTLFFFFLAKINTLSGVLGLSGPDLARATDLSAHEVQLLQKSVADCVPRLPAVTGNITSSSLSSSTTPYSPPPAATPIIFHSHKYASHFSTG